MATDVTHLRTRIGIGIALLALAAVYAAWQTAPAAPAPGQLLNWVDLVPQGWTPVPVGGEVAALRDDSAAGRAKWAELQRAWETAPLKQTLNGVQVRINGYVVPLAGDMHGLTELLLVPYFGACIHSPPPPANQVVWVRLSAPASGLASFDTIEVAGRMVVSRQQSSLGTSGYAIPDAVLVARGTARPN